MIIRRFYGRKNSEEIEEKNLILVEAYHEEVKPEPNENVVQDSSATEQLRSDVEFLSMMTGVDLGGD